MVIFHEKDVSRKKKVFFVDSPRIRGRGGVKGLSTTEKITFFKCLSFICSRLFTTKPRGGG